MVFFSIFSSGDHFSAKRNHLGILVNGLMRNIFVKLVLYFGEQFRCCLKIFLLLALKATLFDGA